MDHSGTVPQPPSGAPVPLPPQISATLCVNPRSPQHVPGCSFCDLYQFTLNHPSPLDSCMQLTRSSNHPLRQNTRLSFP